MLDILKDDKLSTALGYMSIACWSVHLLLPSVCLQNLILSIPPRLWAQFPQVYQNYKVKNCEGLALPFLLNWAFGKQPLPICSRT